MGNLCCMACVDQASIGVVERWGRFDKLAQPGFHFFNPLAGECLAGLLSTRISSLDVRIETKTKVFVFSLLLGVGGAVWFSRKWMKMGLEYYALCFFFLVFLKLKYQNIGFAKRN